MNDHYDKITDTTKNMLDAKDDLAHKLNENLEDSKGKMDAMNDKVKGKFNQAKGKIKTKVGKMTDNNKLQGEGMVDSVIGKAQEIKGNIKEAIIDTKNKIKK